MGAVSRTITPAKYKKIQMMVSKGATRIQVANYLKISKSQFYRLIVTDETLKEVCEVGDAEDLSNCIGILKERATESRNPGWMDRYLFHRHGLTNGNQHTGNSGNVVINVNLPFQTGTDHIQQGITIDMDSGETGQ